MKKSLYILDFNEEKQGNKSKSISPKFTITELNTKDGRQKRLDLRQSRKSYDSPLKSPFVKNNSFSSGLNGKEQTTDTRMIQFQANPSYIDLKRNSQEEKTVFIDEKGNLLKSNWSYIEVDKSLENNIQLNDNQMNTDINQSKSYVSAMKALQRKVKTLERQIEEGEEEKKDQEDRYQFLENYISQRNQMFNQLEKSLFDKLKESETEFKEQENYFAINLANKQKEITELQKQYEREKLKQREQIEFMTVQLDGSKKREEYYEREKTQLEQKVEDVLKEKQNFEKQAFALSTSNLQLEDEKEDLANKIDNLEKQQASIQSQKDTIVKERDNLLVQISQLEKERCKQERDVLSGKIKNEPNREEQIQQLQDQLYKQVEFNERERQNMQFWHENTKEGLMKELEKLKEDMKMITKENERLYIDSKHAQEQLVILSRQKYEFSDEIDRLVMELEIQQEKMKVLGKQNAQLKEIVEQSKHINGIFFQNIQKTSHPRTKSAYSFNQEQACVEFNHTTPIKNMKSTQISSLTLNGPSESYSQLHSQNLQQNISFSNPSYKNNIFHQETHNQNDNYTKTTEKIEKNSHNYNRTCQNKLKNLSLDRLPNQIDQNPLTIEDIVYLPRTVNYEHRNDYSQTTLHDIDRNDQYTNSSSRDHHQSSSKQSFVAKNIPNQKIPELNINSINDQLTQEHYKYSIQERKYKQTSIVEEIDDIISQILIFEKEINAYIHEKQDLQQEIQNFTGEKIFSDMLRIRLDSVLDRIKKKQDTISYLKRKEQDLQRQLKEI